MKKIFVLLIGLIVIAGGVYIGGWYYVADTLKKEIKQFYETDGPLLGYNFLGDEPQVSGFPYKPVVTYDKGLSKGEMQIQFDKMTVSAYPFPDQDLDVEIDNLVFQETPTSRPFEINKLKMKLVIPKYFPSDMTYGEVAAWQQKVGHIIFKSIEINKNNMFVTAQGIVGLDPELQITTNLTTKTTDYINLLHFMTAETSEISPLTGGIILSALNGLAKKDPETGKKYVEFTLTIKDRKVYVGPILTVSVPFIKWPDKI